MPDRPTHYEVLGVSSDAATEQVHRAYLDAARRHHPDRNAGSGDSSAEMAKVNEAWRVLGHPGRRRQYDRELRGEDPYLGGGSNAASATSAGSTSRPFDDDDLVDVAPAGGHSLFGFVPWLLVFGALAVIFVFTAYAATDGGADDADRTDDPAGAGEASEAGGSDLLGRCIVITSGRPTVAPIDCAVGNDGQVVEVVEPGAACPTDTRPLRLPDEGVTACLAG